jgi:alpha-galactosidase
MFTTTCLVAASFSVAEGETIPLSKLDLNFMTAGWGRPMMDKSVTVTPLRIAKQEFAAGVGTHAESVLFIDLAGQAERFQARVGVDDNAQVAKASLEFAVYGDDQPLFRSGLGNLNKRPGTLTVTWKDLGIAKPQRLRDLWRQQDVSVSANGCTAKLPGHGVALFRIWLK